MSIFISFKSNSSDSYMQPTLKSSDGVAGMQYKENYAALKMVRGDSPRNAIITKISTSQ